MSTRTNVATIKKQLESRRSEVLDRIESMAHVLQGGTAASNEILRLLGRGDREEAQAISAALARIASGTYGVCTCCGHQIGDARLLALPETPLCRTCAMQEDDLFDNVPV